jgi:hypothetical protein
MARNVAATFTGATAFDVDVDAPTFKRVLKNASAEIARVYDELTGSHSISAADTINHSGGGRGALLGVPLWQQRIGAALTYTSPTSAKDGTPGQTWACAQPFFVPDGETECDAEVDVTGPLDAVSPFVRVTLSDGTAVDLKAMAKRSTLGQGEHTYFCRISGLTRGWHLAFLEVDTTVQGYRAETITLHAWRGFFGRIRGQRVAGRSDTGQNVGVTTPSATDGVAHVEMDASLFADGAPVHGYLTAYTHRNLQGLMEFGSGAPAGGNAAYTHVDHDGTGVADQTNPTRSRFSAGTRTLYAAEPEVDFPLWSEAFGAFRGDGGSVVVAAATPTVGMLQWFAPMPRTATQHEWRRLLLRYPDFLSSPSKLELMVLVGTDSAANLADWRMYLDGPGSVGPISPSAVFAVAGSDAVLATFHATAVGFTGDALTNTRLSWAKTSARNVDDEIFGLGAALAFKP